MSEAASDFPELRGELGPRAFQRWLTLLFSVTGVLLVLRGLRLFAVVVLRKKAPATLRLSDRGLELSYQTLLLGKLTGEHRVVIPLREIARVDRRLRYQGIAFYLGVGALVLGTALGARWFAEGLASLSTAPSLLALGLGVTALGLALDFLFTTGIDSSRGQCQLAISVREQAPITVAGLDAPLVDAVLARLEALLLGQGSAVDEPP